MEHHTGLEDEPISNFLEQMCYPVTDEDKQWAWDTKTKTEAAGLLKDIQLSEFIVSYTSRYFLHIQRMLQSNFKVQAKMSFQHMRTLEM